MRENRSTQSKSLAVLVAMGAVLLLTAPSCAPLRDLARAVGREGDDVARLLRGTNEAVDTRAARIWKQIEDFRSGDFEETCTAVTTLTEPVDPVTDELETAYAIGGAFRSEYQVAVDLEAAAAEALPLNSWTVNLQRAVAGFDDYLC